MADDGASMPPPPARVAALSNADFRAMLATPRRDAGSSGGGGGAAAPKPRKAADKKKPPKPKPKAEGDEEEGAPVYRCVVSGRGGCSGGTVARGSAQLPRAYRSLAG